MDEGMHLCLGVATKYAILRFKLQVGRLHTASPRHSLGVSQLLPVNRSRYVGA